MTTSNEELRPIVEAATQGEWKHGVWSGHCKLKHVGTMFHWGPNHPTDPCVYTREFTEGSCGIAHSNGSMIVSNNYDELVISDADARFIATFNPAKVKAMLDQIDALVDALQMAKHIVNAEGTDEQICQVFAALESVGVKP